MTSIIITRPSRSKSHFDHIKADVLNCLRGQPNRPLSFDEINSRVSSVNQGQIERALSELEGPVFVEQGPTDAYVHCCHRNMQAVYIK